VKLCNMYVAELSCCNILCSIVLSLIHFIIVSFYIILVFSYIAGNVMFYVAISYFCFLIYHDLGTSSNLGLP